MSDRKRPKGCWWKLLITALCVLVGGTAALLILMQVRCNESHARAGEIQSLSDESARGTLSAATQEAKFKKLGLHVLTDWTDSRTGHRLYLYRGPTEQSCLGELHGTDPITALILSQYQFEVEVEVDRALV